VQDVHLPWPLSGSHSLWTRVCKPLIDRHETHIGTKPGFKGETEQILERLKGYTDFEKLKELSHDHLVAVYCEGLVSMAQAMQGRSGNNPATSPARIRSSFFNCPLLLLIFFAEKAYAPLLSNLAPA